MKKLNIKPENLTLFDKANSKKSQPKISIQRSGNITFNKAFCEKYGETVKNYAKIYHAEEQKFLLFEFVEDPKKGETFFLSEVKSSKTKSEIKPKMIHSRSFFDYSHIQLEKAKGQYEPMAVTVDGIGELTAIQLK